MNLDLIRNIEIEQNIIGCMITDIKSILATINKNVVTGDFYEDKHKIIFKAILEIFEEKQQVDVIVLNDYLKNKSLITAAGGVTYITEISGSVASTTNISSYIDALKNYSEKRKIIDIENYIDKNKQKDNELLKAEIHSKVLGLFDTDKSSRTMKNAGESFLSALQKRSTGETLGIRTNLKALDERIGGLYPSELITLFAFSSVGKTALALQLAINIMEQGKKVLYFSLEMPAEQIIERLNSNICSIASKDLRDGNLQESEWNQIIKTTNYLCNENRLLISDKSNLSEIIAKIQLEKLKSSTDIVFIDYLTLIESQREERRDLQIANITRKFKLLALQLNIPIVILAQAKQSTNDKSSSKYAAYEKVSETDIGESGAIYKDSDKVLALFRSIELDDPMARAAAARDNKLDYNSKDATHNPDCMNLLIKKCRNGQKGTLAFRWQGKYYRISNFN